MIAKLKGILDSVGEDHAVIDVGGVGYLVYCSTRTLRSLPGPGEAATLEIETHVREDHIHLYGFAAPAERDWFRLLTSVQGVGARVALAILSVLSADDLAGALTAQDSKLLTQAPGVGPKLAARIVNELKDKTGQIGIGAIDIGIAASGGSPADSGPTADAVSALVNLGYRPAEAMRAVSTAARELDGADVGDLIKRGLQELAG